LRHGDKYACIIIVLAWKALSIYFVHLFLLFILNVGLLCDVGEKVLVKGSVETVGDWPLMDEEILILETGDKMYFNFPYTLFRKELRKRLMDYNVEAKVTENALGGKRVELIVDKQVGLEIKAWLALRLPTMDGKYFITEMEEV
jgi:hypothetical protein